MPFLGFSVKGPLGRSVADVALAMAVMAGPDARDPGCLPSDPTRFQGALARDPRGTRVAWCPDLGGLPLEPEVRRVLDPQRATLEGLGCIVEDAAPELAHADEVFLTNSSWGVLPVTQVEGKPISDGAVGPISKRLVNDWADWTG